MNPVITRCYGDKAEAQMRRPLALELLRQLKHSMNFQMMEQGIRRWDLPDGTRLVAMSILGIDTVKIYVPSRQPVAIETPEDVWIAFNTKERGGAWDIDESSRIANYKQGVPTQTWEPAEYNTGSLEGDPVIYFYPHTLTPDNDSRFNVLKSWTYNLRTKTTDRGGWVAADSITIFHRKSISFNDIIRGVPFPYYNYGESIDVYRGKELLQTPFSIASHLESAMNFYVAPNGHFSIIRLQAYQTGPPNSVKDHQYLLRINVYDPDGNEVSSNSYTSSIVHVDYFDSWGPITVAYDGSDFYCTVNCGDIAGGQGGLPSFTEGFIHVSATKLYDYDLVDRVVTSYDKEGYVDGDTYPTRWFLGFVSWYDFARRQWMCLDMNFEGDSGGRTWTCVDSVVGGQPVTVFTQTSSTPYTTEFGRPMDENPRFWCGYDDYVHGFEVDPFPQLPAPWNIHYTIAGYRRINTEYTFNSQRSAFDQVALFSQKSGTLPNATTILDDYYRPMGKPTPVANNYVSGGEAKWTANGIVLRVEKRSRLPVEALDEGAVQ